MSAKQQIKPLRLSHEDIDELIRRGLLSRHHRYNQAKIIEAVRLFMDAALKQPTSLPVIDSAIFH